MIIPDSKSLDDKNKKKKKKEKKSVTFICVYVFQTFIDFKYIFR